MSLLASVTDEEKLELSYRVKVVTVPDGICVTKTGYLPPTPALYIVKSGLGLIGDEFKPTTSDLDHKAASEMNGRELTMRSIFGEETVSQIFHLLYLWVNWSDFLKYYILFHYIYLVKALMGEPPKMTVMATRALVLYVLAQVHLILFIYTTWCIEAEMLKTVRDRSYLMSEGGSQLLF